MMEVPGSCRTEVETHGSTETESKVDLPHDGVTWQGGLPSGRPQLDPTVSEMSSLGGRLKDGLAEHTVLDIELSREVTESEIHPSSPEA